MAKSNNRKQASGKAKQQLLIDSLDNIGSNRGDFQTTAFTAIEVCALDFIERVKINIQAEPDFVITGNIENLKIESYPDRLDLTHPAYLSYQDKGVNGSKVQKYQTPFQYTDRMPPVHVFREMVRTKNIQLRNEEFYGGDPSRYEDLNTDKLIDKAAWGMATKIFKEGFKPRNIYSKEIPQLEQDVQNAVANLAADWLGQIIITNDGSRVKLKKK